MARRVRRRFEIRSDGRAAARVVAVGATGRVSRASAAGVPWACRALAAQWAARAYHTSAIDAAGAIYVLGGISGAPSFSYYKDVWVSTDGGEDLNRIRGILGGS